MTNVALIAHDEKKDDMVNFANRHYELLKECKLIATGTTGKIINKETKLKVERMASGPLGGDPKLRSGIGRFYKGKDIHSLVGKGVQHIQKSDEQVGYTQKYQGIVVHVAAHVPNQQENAPSDRNGKQFGNNVKQQVIVSADYIQTQEKPNTQKHINNQPEPFQQVFPVHFFCSYNLTGHKSIRS